MTFEFIRARASANRVLLDDVRRLQARHHGRYGSPRMHAAVRAEGHCCSRRRVDRLMRHHRIRALAGRRFRPCTADSRHHLAVARNLLARDASRRPRRTGVWATGSAAERKRSRKDTSAPSPPAERLTVPGGCARSGDPQGGGPSTSSGGRIGSRCPRPPPGAAAGRSAAGRRAFCPSGSSTRDRAGSPATRRERRAPPAGASAPDGRSLRTAGGGCGQCAAAPDESLRPASNSPIAH